MRARRISIAVRCVAALILVASGCSSSTGSVTPKGPPHAVNPPVVVEIRTVLGDAPSRCLEEGFPPDSRVPVPGEVVVPNPGPETSSVTTKNGHVQVSCVRLGPPAFAAPASRVRTIEGTRGSAGRVVFDFASKYRAELERATTALDGTKVSVVAFGFVIAEPLITDLSRARLEVGDLAPLAYERLLAWEHDEG